MAFYRRPAGIANMPLLLRFCVAVIVMELAGLAVAEADAPKADEVPAQAQAEAADAPKANAEPAKEAPKAPEKVEEQAKADCSEQEKVAAQAKEEAAQAKEEAAKAKEELEHLKTAAAADKAKIHQLEEDVKKLNAESQKEKGNHDKAVQDSGKMQEELKAAERQKEAAQKKEADLTKKNGELEKQLATANQALKAATEASKTSAAKLEQQLKSSKQEQEQAVAQKEKEVQQARSQHEDATKKAQAISQQKDKLETQLTGLQKQMSRLQADFSAEKEKYETVEEKHFALKASHQELVKRYEDPSMEEFLRNRAIKIYEQNPVVAGAVNKSYKYIVPRLRYGYDVAEQELDWTVNQTMYAREKFTEELSAFASPKAAVVVSGILVYGLGLFPCLLTFMLLSSIRTVLKLRPILMFCHLYIFLVCLTATFAAIALQVEPLGYVHQEYYGVYLFSQGLIACGYVAYLSMQLLAFMQARNFVETVVRCMQIALNCAVGLLYYHTVWMPAMLDKPPHFEGLVADVVPRPWNLMVPYCALMLLYALVLRLEQHSNRARSRADVEEDKVKLSLDFHGRLPEGAQEDIELCAKQA
eukprot:TRINITY_DN4349_c0_g1_i1.p1 TRINITY_DN4349_c0_g1~~TRINITY_DN4349_c0_g1_i1.p1  ORF type:complete len:587 (+),score=203.75 TRINITY_DN4349_c0_g1_i1:167-1927(+)